ncbi:hypothetical protein DMENIID0001_048340 [Sergentomyia squamirostris]
MSKKSRNKGDSASSINNGPSSTVFFTVLFYCLLIIFLPILCFFGFKRFIFDGYFELSQVTSNIYAAVVAIIALHVALFFYIYRAYFEQETKPTRVQLNKED